MKKITILALAIMIVITGCQFKTNQDNNQYTRYTDSFFDTFNTLIVVVGYTESEEEFEGYFNKIKTSYGEYHKLYDIYNDYEGINNVKTINDHAGIKPIKVDQRIIDLLLYAREWSQRTGGDTNVAFGSVLKIWHQYRTEGIDNPNLSKLPPIEVLEEAVKHTDIDKVIIDVENNTVFLEDSRMSLDVGAIAKGYATEMVAQEIMAEGMISGVISAGGNIRTIGKPLDGVREQWVIGIQDPRASIFSDENLDSVFVNNGSVVSSGDYQRYYYVGDELIHHIIDPKTLMPANYYRAVTIVAEDSGLADFLSTAIFLKPFEEGKELIEEITEAEALWVMPDGSVEISEGMKEILGSYGATNKK
ncbi:FAD:protein FMN transferase [Alkaliphilus transvaalensis]|uniref:FAD:protein FMN transferase n=1 Tax=Alkaliphilus transvaalensis TaxID=114628 RepID=UPI00054F1EDD|nr:FAD:protein FMN transferase [Alkaliphilus transvaalensis]